MLHTKWKFQKLCFSNLLRADIQKMCSHPEPCVHLRTSLSGDESENPKQALLHIGPLETHG